MNGALLQEDAPRSATRVHRVGRRRSPPSRRCTPPSIRASETARRTCSGTSRTCPRRSRVLFGGDFTTAAGYLRTETFSALGPDPVPRLRDRRRRTRDRGRGRGADARPAPVDADPAAPGAAATSGSRWRSLALGLAIVLGLTIALIGPCSSCTSRSPSSASTCLMLFLLATAFGTIALAVGCCDRPSRARERDHRGARDDHLRAQRAGSCGRRAVAPATDLPVPVVPRTGSTRERSLGSQRRGPLRHHRQCVRDRLVLVRAPGSASLRATIDGLGPCPRAFVRADPLPRLAPGQSRCSVFLCHAAHPFDAFDWHVKNAEQSDVISGVMVFFLPWGLGLFFMLAGSGAFFSLRSRSTAGYASERVSRLLVPLIVAWTALSPLQGFIESRHLGTGRGRWRRLAPRCACPASGSRFLERWQTRRCRSSWSTSP